MLFFRFNTICSNCFIVQVFYSANHYFVSPDIRTGKYKAISSTDRLNTESKYNFGNLWSEFNIKHFRNTVIEKSEIVERV